MNDDAPGSTKRFSAVEMKELKNLLDARTTELKFAVDADVMERVRAVISKMDVEDGSSPELQHAMAVRQIFMAGLYSLERELTEE